VNVVTDKPNKRGNRFLDRDEALLESLCKTYLKDHPLQSTIKKDDNTKTMNKRDEHFNELLQQTTKTPTEKYANPITASQEIGWHHNDKNQTQSRFHRPKVMCDETVYADALLRSSTVQQYSAEKKDAKK
jgi:hypothetical protein